MEPAGNQWTVERNKGKGISGFALRRLLLALAAIALLIAVFGGIGLNTCSHKALAKFKADLRAKGERLTFDELYARDTSESAVSREELKAAGSALGQLRLCPGALDLMVYVGPGQAQVAWKQDRPPWNRNTGSGGADTWEEYDAEIAAAGEKLAVVRQALKDPPAYWGPRASRELWAPIPNCIYLRQSAQWLVGEAIGRLHQGHLEGALQDLEGLASCAQVNREEYTLVCQIIRVAVAGMGLSATWEALQAPGWTEPELARLQAAWERVDLIEAVEKGFIGERAGGEETWRQAHRTSGRRLRLALTIPGTTKTTARTIFNDYIQFPVYRLTRIDEDELFFLKGSQDAVERIRGIKRGQPWIELADGMSVGAAKIAALGWFTGPFRHWISINRGFNFTRAVQISAQNETLRQLTLAAIAIKRFQLRYGHLPLNLAALSPEFLAHPTFDPMSGGQLQYVLRENGRFMLYSTGNDHRDDGGERPFWFRGKPGMWEELDAIWPEAQGTEFTRN